MYCQKCGKRNQDDATFCNSCGTNLTNKSTMIRVRNIQLKENEIRLLQKKYDKEASDGPVGLTIIWILFIVFFVYAMTISPGASIGVIIMLYAIYHTWTGDNSKYKASKETKAKLNAAKAELERMKNA